MRSDDVGSQDRHHAWSLSRAVGCCYAGSKIELSHPTFPGDLAAGLCGTGHSWHDRARFSLIRSSPA